jgi:hypothetical protein
MPRRYLYALAADGILGLATGIYIIGQRSCVYSLYITPGELSLVGAPPESGGGIDRQNRKAILKDEKCRSSTQIGD